MSLIKMHTRAVEESRDRGVELSGALLVDGRYTHREVGDPGEGEGVCVLPWCLLDLCVYTHICVHQLRLIVMVYLRAVTTP